MECQDQTQVSGYRIWEHEIEWLDRRAARAGYLFFGAPNQRSTAAPPRDFYLYFMPYFDDEAGKPTKEKDEVFFTFTNPSAELVEKLRLYAAALELAPVSTGGARKVYQDKAEASLADLTKSLRENITTVYEVEYKGQKKPLPAWIKNKVAGTSRRNVRDIINLVGSACLADHFAEQAP